MTQSFLPFPWWETSLAFQVKDDLFDILGNEKTTGKKIGAETVLVCTGEYQNAKKDNLKINNTLIYNTLTDYLLTI